MTVTTKLEVVVHYAAAGEPFRDEHADGAETVGQLKVRVLTFFGLVEGQTPEGNIVAYALYHRKAPLENPNVTLTEVSENKRVLELKLSQQITQG